jgi:PAS domain-containing protein
MNKAVSYPSRATARKFYFRHGIASSNELAFHQNFYRELLYLQHELAGGLAEDGSVICVNDNLMQFLTPPGSGVTADCFFSSIYPEDRDRVREYFRSVSEVNHEIAFDCLMVSGTGDVRRVGWVVKASPGIPPVRFLVIGYLFPDQTPNESILETYRSMLDEMVQAWNQQLRHIRKKIELEILRRRKIEKTLSRLIDDVESEVITLREVLQNVPGFLFVFDSSGTLQFINRQGAELLGAPGYALVGKRASELGLAPEIRDLIGDMQNRDGAVASRGIVRTGDRDYEFGLTALHSNDGSITGTQLLLQDA